MVRFPDTSGVDAHDAVRRARGLHPVELDKPRDKERKVRRAHKERLRAAHPPRGHIVDDGLDAVYRGH